MILITLGTQKFQLNRLLKEIDELILAGDIKDDVFAQIGHSDYKPKHYKYVDFMPKSEFEDMVGLCDLLITHSGAGTIILGLSKKKPIIVFPRLVKYKEHVDDHQLQIAKSFEQKNYVLLCGEESNLGEIVKKSQEHTFTEYTSQRGFMVKTIDNFLNSF